MGCIKEQDQGNVTDYRVSDQTPNTQRRPSLRSIFTYAAFPFLMRRIFSCASIAPMIKPL